jgi:flagellar basal-body rod modification protein FlgD
MSTTDAVTNTYVSSAYTKAQTPSSSLDKDGFLKLLTAQLKNQDPSSNQDPSQYFQTISQMTMVEQMTNLAKQSASTGAQQLLGRTVAYRQKDGSVVTGKVDAVDLTTSSPTVSVAGKPGIDPANITQVS